MKIENFPATCLPEGFSGGRQIHGEVLYQLECPVTGIFGEYCGSQIPGVVAFVKFISSFREIYFVNSIMISLLRVINFVMASGESGAWLSIARS